MPSCTDEDTRNKTQIGERWAQASDHAYATIENMKHGGGMTDLMRAATGCALRPASKSFVC